MPRTQSQEKLREMKLRNYLQKQKGKTKKAYGGLEGKQSWGAKANALEYSFRNLTKSLTNSNRSVKGV